MPRGLNDDNGLLELLVYRINQHNLVEIVVVDVSGCVDVRSQESQPNES